MRTRAPPVSAARRVWHGRPCCLTQSTQSPHNKVGIIKSKTRLPLLLLACYFHQPCISNETHHGIVRPSPTLSPTDPAPRGLLTLCPGASSGPQGLYTAYMRAIILRLLVAVVPALHYAVGPSGPAA